MPMSICSFGFFRADCNYDPDHAVRRSWMSLQHKPLEHFWEHGFWAEIFKDSTGAMNSHEQLFRPQVNQESVTAEL